MSYQGDEKLNAEISTENITLTWEVVKDKFENLVKFAAKQQVQNYSTDTMISAEDLYQEGMIKLYDCWVIWCVGKNKDMDEFGPIFRTSLFRDMKNKGKGKKSFTFVDIEDSANLIKDESVEEYEDKVHREEGLVKLRDILDSEVSKRLLDEIVNPSERTLFEVWADTKRKEMLKSQGRRVNIPKDNTVRMKHISRALGITNKQYDVAMMEIREKAHIALKE